MTMRAENAAPDNWYRAKRTGGLARFALAITVLNTLGHLWLGFEQSWATPFVAVAAGYATELILESVSAWASGRHARYRGGPAALVFFLLPAHISGLAVGMLLYANERLAVVAFAVAVAIASKYVLRLDFGVDCNGRVQSRHFLNPSNFGITVTLLLFPWVGIAPPYMFTENISGIMDWILPAIIIVTGSLLNTKFTERIPLILAWWGGFAAQAVIRAMIHESSMVAGLMPITGFAFLLFSFYMVTDPPTTPASRREQILFGLAVAAAYGVLMELHVVFGLFFALTAVTAGRGFLIFFRRRGLISDGALESLSGAERRAHS